MDAGYIIYTDGSVLWNPDGPGGWAAHIENQETGEVERLSGSVESSTNQRMEMLAVIEGLSRVPDGAQVRVRSDSSYVIRAFTENWWKRWEQNGWWTSDYKPVANKDMWERLIGHNKRISVTWEHIKGHNGNFYNEICDALASQAAEEILRVMEERDARLGKTTVRKKKAEPKKSRNGNTKRNNPSRALEAGA